MTARILSRHGNVIAADFRPRRLDDLSLTFKTEILFEDEHILITRTSTTLDGKPYGVLTLAGNKATGHIVQF